MNHIEKIRTELKKEFIDKKFQISHFETFLSPSKQFRLDATEFGQKEHHFEMVKVEIYDQKLNEKIFDLLVNYGAFFHGWVTKNNVEYLLSAEDIYGGQTVVDLTNRKIAGYSNDEDGFIWTDFHASPDGKHLATIGCYWASPYILKLFDFSNPMNLPLPVIKEIELLDADENIIGWIDNDTIQMKGVQRERIPEYSASGSFSMKTIKETNAERQIKINGI